MNVTQANSYDEQNKSNQKPYDGEVVQNCQKHEEWWYLTSSQAIRPAASSQPQIPITAYALLWQWPINMPLSPQNKCKGSAKIRALINDGIQIRAWCARRGNDSIVDTGTANRDDETDVMLATNCFLPSWFSAFSLTDYCEMWSIELNKVNQLKSTRI